MNLLNDASDSKFVRRKWNIGNDQWNVSYDAGSEILYNTEVLKSNLCDYNDTYILVKDDIIVTVAPQTRVSFKNCAPYIPKIDDTTTNDTEDLDLVMPIYNLIEYNPNYSEATRSLWFCSKHKVTSFVADLGNR